MNSLAKFALSVAGMIGCLGAVAAPVAYTLDPDHTVPRFSINHNGFSNHVGMFTKAAGKAVLDFSARTGSVEVTIQHRSHLAMRSWRVWSGEKTFSTLNKSPT